ncbi:MAG: hypothetical protein Q4P30_04265 [Eubacteriales bacterium]|nr:hypothetical protein [Eubacteriales bacterium]
MTLEEKLARFSETLTKETKKREDEMIHDYEKTLSDRFERHKEEAFSRADLKLQHALHTYKNEVRRRSATMRAAGKKLFHKQCFELKKHLREEVLKQLEAFKQTDAYFELLLKMAAQAKAACDACPFVLQIDPSDAALRERLARETGYPVELAEESLAGGLYAYIPEGKVRYNLSFRSRLDDLIDDFQWQKEATYYGK